MPLLCQCSLFIHMCVSKNSIVFKEVIFYLLWYNRDTQSYMQQIFFSLILQFLSEVSESNKGIDRVKLAKCDKVEWGKKCRYTYWMDPCLICCFIAILFYIERRWLLMRDLTTSQNCMDNFSVLMLEMEVLKCWKMVEF